MNPWKTARVVALAEVRTHQQILWTPWLDDKIGENFKFLLCLQQCLFREGLIYHFEIVIDGKLFVDLFFQFILAYMNIIKVMDFKCLNVSISGNAFHSENSNKCFQSSFFFSAERMFWFENGSLKHSSVNFQRCLLFFQRSAKSYLVQCWLAKILLRGTLTSQYRGACLSLSSNQKDFFAKNAKLH